MYTTTTTYTPGQNVQVMVNDSEGDYDAIMVTGTVVSATTALVNGTKHKFAVPTTLVLDLTGTGLANHGDPVTFTLDDLDPDYVDGAPVAVNVFYSTDMAVTVFGNRCDLTVCDQFNVTKV